MASSSELLELCAVLPPRASSSPSVACVGVGKPRVFVRTNVLNEHVDQAVYWFFDASDAGRLLSSVSVCLSPECTLCATVYSC